MTTLYEKFEVLLMLVLISTKIHAAPKFLSSRSNHIKKINFNSKDSDAVAQARAYQNKKINNISRKLLNDVEKCKKMSDAAACRKGLIEGNTTKN